MTNNEVNTFKREQLSKSRQNILYRLRQVDYFELSEYIILLILGRVAIFGSINPFCIAFFAATFPAQKKVYAIPFACVGIILSGFGILSLKYFGSLAIVATFALLLGNEISKRPWIYGLISSTSILLNGLIYVFFDGFLLYDVFMLITESALTLLCFFAFKRAAALLKTLKNRKILENEETLSLILLAAAVILSISSIPNMSGLAHILSSLIIMLLSLTGGAAISAMAGTLLGLVISTSDVLPAQVVGIYSICAISSGLLRRYGKWGVSGGFLISNAIAVLYFNSSTVTFIAYYYILAAAAILFILPDRVLSVFGAVARTPGFQPADDIASKLKTIVKRRLNETSEAFSELSGIFKELIEDKISTDLRDATQVFEKTADTVCKTCSMSRYCWQKNYNNTSKMLEKMLPVIKERGYAADIDFSPKFREDCLKFGDFISALNKNYEAYKINLMWSGRVLESRCLVAEQFENVSSVLNNIGSQLDSDIAQDMQLENKIAAALDRKGISAGNICLTSADGFEVSMLSASCGGKLNCSTTVAATISEALGVPMLRTSRSCSDEVCKLHFREQERYVTDIGLAQLTRDDTKRTGDSLTYTLLDNGKFVLALSDGMGSGARANLQSTITVELIKRLLGAGFDKDTSLKLINSVLLTNTEEETFATVDMCLVNLYTGSLEFIKIGAANSYIKSKNDVICIESSSLPAGIVENPEADCAIYSANNGDYIIMATDGVIDVLERSGKDAVKEIITACNSSSAQILADSLLLEAVRLSGGKIKDDMTVLCAAICEVM
ncbi:MAG: stage II sporulation protein E [Clostridia bacterium]|nr:stage II sporulation protein E [Clostridia bacterium]